MQAQCASKSTNGDNIMTEHPIWLGIWMGAWVMALATDVAVLTFLGATVGAIVGAAAYRQTLIEGDTLCQMD